MKDLPPPILHQRGRGPVLVLLHGLGLNRHVWDPIGALLEDRFTVVTYDLPGHGAAPVPDGGYSVADLSQQLATALAAAGIARAHIAGLSLGGLIAQHFAATWPDRVVRTILIDTTPAYSPDWQRIWRERAANARANGTAALVETLLGLWFSPAALAAGGGVIADIRACVTATSDEGYALGCEALAAADLQPLASRIPGPMVVMCGEDETPLFRDAAVWFQSHLNDVRLSWLPGRHLAVLENPSAFVAALDG